jgi:hypothetical protein
MTKYIYLVILIIGIAIGGSVAWWVQGVRIGHLQANVETLTGQLKACQEANVSNQVTIGELTAEVRNANGICDTRLKTKDALVKRLQEIDNMKQGEKDETGKTVDDADPLSGELNRMFAPEPDRKN